MLSLLHNEVQAQAVVDVGAFEVRDRVHAQAFLVTCFGQLEGGDPLQSRAYEIEAPDETTAAFRALDRYAVDMQRVN